MVSFTMAKDFAHASFQVVISRVQQAALDKANAPVPCPEDQLAMLRQKRGKVERLSLELQHKPCFKAG